MAQLNASTKFLGSQVEFGIQNPDDYTLDSLWADVYMCTYCTLPDPIERFTAEVRLPWTGQYLTVSDNRELQDIFKMFRLRKLDTIQMNVELLPLATLPAVDDDIHVPGSPSSFCSNNGAEKAKDKSTPVLNISNDEEQDSEMGPPVEKKLPGRPKKKRKKSLKEPAKKRKTSGIQCGSCGERGHNSRTCNGRASAQSKDIPKGKGVKTVTRKRTTEVRSSSRIVQKKRTKLLKLKDSSMETSKYSQKDFLAQKAKNRHSKVLPNMPVVFVRCLRNEFWVFLLMLCLLGLLGYEIMAQLNVSAKFLGSQVEFGIQNPDDYTLDSLWGDVYMCTYCTLPDPIERFTAEVRLPWTGQYLTVSDNRELQDIFKMFRLRKLDTIQMNVELLPLATLSAVDDDIHVPGSPSSFCSNNGAEKAKDKSTPVLNISNDEEQDSEMGPPVEKKLPGRPKKKRKKSLKEPAKKRKTSGIQCGSCGERGHNSRTCNGRASAQSKDIPKGKGVKTVTRKRTTEVGSSSKIVQKKRTKVT
ncbi:hypothetical protein ACOSQ3_014034 [Xanthoceras sorbifolium]